MSSRDDVINAVTELRPSFPSSAFLLFAMGLRLASSDYEQLHRDSVLDGPDDKKIDFFHIERDAGCAIIAQGFESPQWEGAGAPSNKASDLNTACAWLLDSDLNIIPRPSVRVAAEELRDALESGAVHTLEVYYAHNCPHSKNVDHELATVEASLRNRLAAWADKAGMPTSSVARQLSLEDVVALYESRHASIRIGDTLNIRTLTAPQTVTGPNWRAVSTTVPALELIALVDKYGDAVYSANIRDYFGVRAYTRNINRQIAQTAATDPANFWVFNNGITLVSRHLEAREDSLRCSGLAVVNGAQTLGCLTDASKEKDARVDEVSLPIRVVESGDEELIQQIIRYNNTQNPIKPWELRVLDPVQKQIERDFEDKLSITYQFRRGLGRRAAEDVLCEKLGPWLNSFYGDPTTSHRNSPELFDNEAKYRSLFNEGSDVRHLLFVYRLGEAIGATKDRYRASSEEGTANETEVKLYGYFRYGAFTHVVLHLCAEMLTELFGGGANVKNRFVLDDDLSRERGRAVALLNRLVKFTLAPVPSELADKDAYQELRSIAGIGKLADRVRVTVNQMQSVSPEVVARLKEGIQIL